MTLRLYEENTYLKESDALVLSCKKHNEHYEIIPDRSVFYPEGGGQSGDRGILRIEGTDTAAEETAEQTAKQEPARVLDTQERGEDIVLICDAPVEPGVRVRECIDWTYRFDRMQNHSGEHIVSGLIHERFHYNNVGFHMSGDRMTIDLDGEVPEEALREIEEAANRVVWANLPVRTDVYTEEEAEKIEFRSKKELHGAIRVVTIPGADACACCGTHVAFTGEIGPVRILSHERFRGGSRIEMACGRWAYCFMTDIFRQNREVSVLLSSPQTETAKAAKKLLQSETALRESLTGLRYAQIERTASDLAGEDSVLLFAPDYTPQLLQKLTARVMERSSGIIAAFSGSEEDGYRYVIGQEGGDLRELVKQFNEALGGRGGGRPYFMQGSVTAGRDAVISFAKEKIKAARMVTI